jgi:hypothetical protein
MGGRSNGRIAQMINKIRAYLEKHGWSWTFSKDALMQVWGKPGSRFRYRIQREALSSSDFKFALETGWTRLVLLKMIRINGNPDESGTIIFDQRDPRREECLNEKNVFLLMDSVDDPKKAPKLAGLKWASFAMEELLK